MHGATELGRPCESSAEWPDLTSERSSVHSNGMTATSLKQPAAGYYRFAAVAAVHICKSKHRFLLDSRRWLSIYKYAGIFRSTSSDVREAIVDVDFYGLGLPLQHPLMVLVQDLASSLVCLPMA